MNTSNHWECCLIVLILVIHQSVIAAVEFATDGQPYNVTISKGESVKFDCRVTGLLPGKSYTLHWKFNDAFVDRGKYVIHESIENSALCSTLTVMHGKTNDQGLYGCDVYKGDQYAFSSRKGFLKVELNLRFRRQPSNKDVVIGQNVTQGCSVYDYDDTLTIKWFRRGTVISQGYKIPHSDESDYGDLKIGGESGSGVFDLIISNVSREISGKFQCKVFRKGQKQPILQSTTARITVMYPPGGKYPLCNSSSLNKSFVEGDVIETVCWARGGNTPVYFEWIKNGESSNGTLKEDKRVYLLKFKWILTANDDGKKLLCKMKGPAITNERQCSIGPIQVQPRSTETFTVTEGFTYETSSETTNNATDTTVNSLPLSPTTGKSEPNFHSSQSATATTLPTECAPSTIEFSVEMGNLIPIQPNDNLGNRIVYATIALAIILIAVVIGIIVLLIDSRKTGIEQSAFEAMIDDEQQGEPRTDENPKTNNADTDPTEVVLEKGEEKKGRVGLNISEVNLS